MQGYTQEQIEYVETEHRNLVTDLVKKPIDITRSLSNRKVDVLHATIGIVGEVGELIGGIAKMDRDNLIEELGDTEFYIRQFRLALSLVEPTGVDFEVAAVAYNQTAFIVAATDLLDLVKKWVIYDKDVDVMLHDMVECIQRIDVQMAAVRAANDINRMQTLTANIRKLRKRYEGGYSNEAAQARADKAPGIAFEEGDFAGCKTGRFPPTMP